jgi:hypothetical protein
MAEKYLEEWPLKEDISDTVLDFLIKYPKLPKERVIVYYDNFILTNYRFYFKNQDGNNHLIPHDNVKEYIVKENTELTLKLRNKDIIKLEAPIPKFEILKKTYSTKEWKKLSKALKKLINKTNAELGRSVREKPIKEEIPVEVEEKPISFSRNTNGIFCPHCGFKITVEEARFCPNCGVDLI